MTNRLHLAAAIVAGATAPVLTAPSAGAVPPSSLTIQGTSVLDRSTIHLGPGNGTAEVQLDGTFTATGAITDSGDEGGELMFSGSGAPDLSSNHAAYTFTGSAGSITVRVQSLHHPFDNPVFAGSWAVVDSTGAYTGLHGSGSVTFAVTGERSQNPVISETWTGELG